MPRQPFIDRLERTGGRADISKIRHECKQLLIESIKEADERWTSTAYEFENRTSVVLVIGVNGVGKTTNVSENLPAS